MSTSQVATVDPHNTVTADQGHCVHCGMHIILNDVGRWMHTMAGLYACEPAWRPRLRPALTLLKGAES